MVFGPTQPLLVEHGAVAAEEFVGATGGRMPSPGHGAFALKKYRSGHPRLQAARLRDITRFAEELQLLAFGVDVIKAY